MKVIKEASREWSWPFKCPTCKAKCEAHAEDVEEGLYGSGMDDSGEVIHVVTCPCCGFIIQVPDKKLTWVIKGGRSYN